MVKKKSVLKIADLPSSPPLFLPHTHAMSRPQIRNQFFRSTNVSKIDKKVSVILLYLTYCFRDVDSILMTEVRRKSAVALLIKYSFSNVMILFVLSNIILSSFILSNIVTLHFFR
jgi:hypothetical protein